MRQYYTRTGTVFQYPFYTSAPSVFGASILIFKTICAIIHFTDRFSLLFFNFQFSICNLQFIFAGMAESADAPDLGSGGRPCRFDPCYPHHAKDPLKRVFCNDIRSFPIPQNSLRSFRGPLGAPERMIYASRMIYPSGMIYACGVLTGSPQNPRVLWGVSGTDIISYSAHSDEYIMPRFARYIILANAGISLNVKNRCRFFPATFPARKHFTVREQNSAFCKIIIDNRQKL